MFYLKRYTPAYGGRTAYSNIPCTTDMRFAQGSGLETGIPKGTYARGFYQPSDCGYLNRENNGIYEFEIRTMYGTRGFKVIFNLE